MSKHTQKFFWLSFFKQNRRLTVKISSVNKQVGLDDCGVLQWLIAVYGQTPGMFVYNQSVMTSHLVKGKVFRKTFPQTKELRNPPQSKLKCVAIVGAPMTAAQWYAVIANTVGNGTVLAALI